MSISMLCDFYLRSCFLAFLAFGLRRFPSEESRTWIKDHRGGSPDGGPLL
jgi:hypothetical protein